MSPTIPKSPEITQLVDEAWNGVVRVCNTALEHSKVYGFQLMRLPEPDVAALYNGLHFSVIPILETLLTDYDFDPDDGRKLINMKHYLGLLKGIVLAIEADKEEDFTRAVEALESQSFL